MNDNVERQLAQLQHGRSTFTRRPATQIEDLESRRNDAAAWCNQHLNLDDIRNCLRPNRIAPRPLSTNRWDAVDDVCARRNYDFVTPPPTFHPSGRLLVYFPDEDLTDGAAEVASRGFFDVYNAPPWGTWVGYFEDGVATSRHPRYLLAWVPDALVAVANAGIEANPEQCIAWFADVQVGLRSIV